MLWACLLAAAGPAGALDPCWTRLQTMAQPCNASDCLHQVLIPASLNADLLVTYWGRSLLWPRATNARHVLWPQEQTHCIARLYFPEVWEAFQRLPPPEQRAAAGLMLLHKYGGMYADLSLAPPRTPVPLSGADCFFLPGELAFAASARGASVPYFVLLNMLSGPTATVWNATAPARWSLRETLVSAGGGDLTVNDTFRADVLGKTEVVRVLDPTGFELAPFVEGRALEDERYRPWLVWQLYSGWLLAAIAVVCVVIVCVLLRGGVWCCRGYRLVLVKGYQSAPAS